MDTELLMLDVGQANEIKLAARRGGATNADLKRLSEGDMFAQILPVLRGFGTVVFSIMVTKPVENFNLVTFIDKDWSVWRGPADGNGLEGEEARDVREDSLTEVDWGKVLYETNLNVG